MSSANLARVIEPEDHGHSQKLHRVIPSDLGPVGEHMVLTLIKAIQDGSGALLVITSDDGRDQTRLALPARKVAS